MLLFRVLFLQIVLLSSFYLELYAQESSVNSILKELQILRADITLKDLESAKFSHFNSNYLTISSDDKPLWIKLILYNRLSKKVDLDISFSSPLIDKIDVYKKDKKVILFKHLDYRKKDTILPHFNIILNSNSTKTFYIKIKSSFIKTNFTIDVKTKAQFISQDRVDKLLNISIFGFILALIILFSLLFIYSRDKSLLFFVIYLIISLYLFLFSSGLMALYIPYLLVNLTFNIYVILLNILFISFSIYSALFLKIDTSAKILAIYKILNAMFFIEILVASFIKLPNYILLITSILFLVTNIFIGINRLFLGIKEARFYILGLSILGIYLITKFFIRENIDMLIYLISTLFLSLAYLDRLYLNKNREIAKLVSKFDKKFILEKKIEESKSELERLEKCNILLKEEINVTLKKSLESTISMLQIQSRKLSDTTLLNSLNKIEQKLLSLVRVYNYLMQYSNLDKIDMREFIEKLIVDTMADYKDSDKDITIITDIDAKLKLQDALYIALSIVDSISTSYNNRSKDRVKIIIKELDDSYKFSMKYNNKNNKVSFFHKLFFGKSINIFRS